MSKARSRRNRSGEAYRSRRLILVMAVLLCVLTVAAGVKEWLYGDLGTIGSRRSVRGVLVDVQGASIVFAEQVTLRSDDGEVQSFRVDPEVATNRDEPQSASHLRQHMVLGDPVIIRYRLTDDGPVAVRIVDAD